MKDKFEKKNHGFTLVEVIVSLALLGIISVALSQYFSSSITTNSQARRVQRASLANQMVLEEIRGTKTLADIAANPEMTELVLTTGGAFQVATTPSWDGSTLVDKGKYYFLRNIVIDDVPYKVLITIDDLPYQEEIASGPKYNKLQIPQINAIGGDENAVFIDDESYNLAALYFFYEKYINLSPMLDRSEDDIRASMVRKLIIEMNDIGDDKVSVSAHFLYTSNIDLLNGISTTSDPLYEETFLKSEFKNMYYFYYPTLDDTEVISITNAAMMNLSFYVVCQDPSESRNAEIRGYNLGTIDVHSNVNYEKGLSTNNDKKLILTDDKKRFTKVIVQAFRGIDDITTDNIISEMETTRGE